MCVIAVKPKGVDMIDRDTMKDMWDYNSDGAGFMYLDNEGYVRIDKGYMKFEDFMKAVNATTEQLNAKDTPMIFHFRITTHGGTSPENTHPFPISTKEAHLKALDVKAHLAMVHNGVISSVDDEKTLSDTQVFIRDIVAPLSRFGDNFLKDYEKLINYGIGSSKLAFLDSEGNITKFGKWQERDGVYYSNLNHVNTYTSYYNERNKYNDYLTTYNSYPTKAYRYSNLEHGKIYKVDVDSSYLISEYGVRKGDYFYVEKWYDEYVFMIDVLTGIELTSPIPQYYFTEASNKEIQFIEDVMDKQVLKDYYHHMENDESTSLSCNPEERYEDLSFADSIGNSFVNDKVNKLKLKKIKNDISFIGKTVKDTYKEFITDDDKWFYDLDNKRIFYRLSNKSFVEVEDAYLTGNVHDRSKQFQGTRSFKGALVSVLSKGSVK